MSAIASAFIKAKKAFSPALKNSTNPHFRSKYADLGNCLEAVNDALLANGIALYQETSQDDSGVTVETVLLHESGESIRSGKLHVPASKQDAQGFGSALTYARRYSLITACGIAPEDDDGNAASKAKPARMPQQDVADWLVVIAETNSLPLLKTSWEKAIAIAKSYGDEGAVESLTAAKEVQKKLLKETANV